MRLREIPDNSTRGTLSLPPVPLSSVVSLRYTGTAGQVPNNPVGEVQVAAQVATMWDTIRGGTMREGPGTK